MKTTRRILAGLICAIARLVAGIALHGNAIAGEIVEQKRSDDCGQTWPVKNEILLKIVNRTQGWGFSCRLMLEDGKRVEGLTVVP